MNECEYCKGGLELVGCREVYGASFNDFQYWHCKPCSAWCQADPETSKPKGVLANKARRLLRMKAAQYINLMILVRADREGVSWQEAATKAYTWLYGELAKSPPGAPAGEVFAGARSFSWMNDEQLELTSIICKPYYDRLIKQAGKVKKRIRKNL